MPGTVTGRFATRREAALAVEHLVQQEGLDRKAVSVLPLGDQNTVGTQIAGSDRSDGQQGSRDRDDGALEGAVEISVVVPVGKADAVHRVLADAGAQDLNTI